MRIPERSTDAAGTMMRSTELIAIGPSTSLVGRGMPKSSTDSALPSYGAQSSRPSAREIGSSTLMPFAQAQAMKSRVPGSSGSERYAARDCECRSFVSWMRCSVMAASAA